jgi:RimJ/RimL family protein N-acetyltransferase
MKHDIQVTGYAFGLRPVTLADAELIVGLRTGSDRSRFLNPIPPSIEQQQVWLQRYFDRGGDYYFVIIRQRDGYPEGLIGLYDVDTVRKRAEWGRWIARPGSTFSRAQRRTCVLAAAADPGILDFRRSRCAISRFSVE